MHDSTGGGRAPIILHGDQAERMPYRLFRLAQVERRADQGLAVAFGEALAFPGAVPDIALWREVTFLVHDPRFIGHYFHFMEIFLALHAFQRAFLPEAAVHRIVFTSDNWTNPAQHNIQRALLTAAYPQAEVVSPATLTPGELRNVVLIDRTLAVTGINKFLEPVLPIASAWTRDFVETIHRHVSADPRPRPAGGTAPRAVYVKRNPPRCLSAGLEAAVLAALRDAGIRVDAVDYAALPWDEQVRVTAGYDLMVGVHGNGLTNMLWLPPHAAVLEIFPAGAHHYDYQILAELKRHTYFGIEGHADGYVFREHSRHGDAFGHGADNNREITDLPWAAVARFIETVRPD
ncbi:glycosyltransferase 61 family protein [Azospirillum sp.]|uniref:glycosyltransferase 61 family protein n=1 Tax=Azospirillum sp. TaxID=34012 RepID=UPI003D7295E0